LESVYQVGAGESLLFINGLQIDFDIYDPFTLLDTLKSEARLLEGFHALDIKVSYGIGFSLLLRKLRR
jgi:UDP-glucose:glycoprotein glucosyltransferase